MADHVDRENLAGELFITQITLYPRRGHQAIRRGLCDIARAITQFVAERPEALNLLRGKTFVRSLH